MSILTEFTGSPYYTREELAKLNNADWAKDQAEYDAYHAATTAKAKRRARAENMAVQTAIGSGYAGVQQGGTDAIVSLGGRGGRTSGGIAGLAGLAGTGSPVGYSSSGGGSSTSSTENTNPGDQNPGDRVDPGVITRAEGGVVPYIQYMQEGGSITSPYADPMSNDLNEKVMYGTMPVRREPIKSDPMPMLAGPQPQQGVGGLFEQIHQQFGMMQSSPLRVYQNYLMQTYAQPEMQQQQQKVDHFLDLVDQAERAHFGAEQSYGFGGGPMMQQYMPQPQAQFEQQTPMDRGIVGGPAIPQATTY